MFSGIVEELGTVSKFSRQGRVSVLEVACRNVLQGVKAGDSIAVNGACLTVVSASAAALRFEVMDQTARSTTIGQASPGQRVNLERALRVGDRISGHFVSGHVDCVGIIRKKRHNGNDLVFDIAIPAEFMRCIIPKGSVAVDGISLTIAARRPPVFSVAIIPHTHANTTLKEKGPSDKVNIECDMLAKRALLM